MIYIYNHLCMVYTISYIWYVKSTINRMYDQAYIVYSIGHGLHHDHQILGYPSFHSSSSFPASLAPPTPNSLTSMAIPSTSIASSPPSLSLSHPLEYARKGKERILQIHSRWQWMLCPLLQHLLLMVIIRKEGKHPLPILVSIKIDFAWLVKYWGAWKMS